MGHTLPEVIDTDPADALPKPNARSLKLTARSVKDLAAPVPQAGQTRQAAYFFDSELKGFGVRCMPATERAPQGIKTWIVQYRIGGRGAPMRRVSLGSTSVLEAAEARGMAKDVLAQVRRGDDPAAERAEIRRSATVTDLSAIYKNEAGTGRKERTKELYESYWRLWIIPEVGTIKARDVKRSDVARLHRKVGASHPTTANRVLTLLAHFYKWAGQGGAVPEGYNPTTGVERFRESARERYLTTDELDRLGAAILEAETIGIPWVEKPGKARSKHAPKKAENRRTKITPQAAAAIRLLVLTGARLREILHLRWSEVDLERGLLLLPDSKTGRKTIVLGSAALAVIADLDKVGEYVIAGQRAIDADKREVGDDVPPEQPRSDLHRPWQLVCRRAGLTGVRLHDLRHTFASYGAAGGLGLPVIGGLLGHADSKTTQRYAHLGSDPLRRASEAISSEISAAMARGGKKARTDG